MEARPLDDPAAFVRVDGLTGLACLRRPGGLGGLLADRYTRKPSIPGSRFSAPVEVRRRRALPVPAAPGAAITP